jgi:hypothetical protein
VDNSHETAVQASPGGDGIDERDIVQGRKAMNLSQWDSYSPDQQQSFKAKIVQMTRAGEMAPSAVPAHA